MSAVRRIGNFLQVQDGDGCRHLLRVTSVQALSDTIRVTQPLDEIVELVAPGERTVPEQKDEAWPF
jgi:hypothetical protein